MAAAIASLHLPRVAQGSHRADTFSVHLQIAIG
jgi:hypothetical protein